MSYRNVDRLNRLYEIAIDRPFVILAHYSQI